LLTGTLPFKDKTEQLTIRKILDCKFTPPEASSKTLQLLNGLLKALPKERLTAELALSYF
jgi:hypothetical protein